MPTLDVYLYREDTDEYKLKLSDVYFSLGEVALESGPLLTCDTDLHST